MQKVLIVDDEQTVGRFLKASVEKFGLSAVFVENGFDALKLLNEQSFDLLLADLKMPLMNGVKLIEQARLLDPKLPVIAVTGLQDPETMQIAWHEGVVDYLVKPLSQEDLRCSISRALANRQEILDLQRERSRLEKALEEKNDLARRIFSSAVESLVTAVEARYPEIAGHSARVAQLAADIGQRLGCTTAALEKLHTAGTMHDVGLLASTSASFSEYETEEQWNRTLSILEPLTSDDAILRSIRHRGEKFDGTGKPQKLAAEAIPLGGRILALAIAYDTRLQSWDQNDQPAARVICQEMEMMAGTHFDPRVVDALWYAIDERESHLEIPQIQVDEIEIISDTAGAPFAE